MVSVLASASSSSGLSLGQGHCITFLSKRLFFHSASLYPGVQMGTGELNAGGNPAMDWHSTQRVEIHCTSSCFMLLKSEINAGLMGHLACTADFFFIVQEMEVHCTSGHK